jgi:hypothetical protein
MTEPEWSDRYWYPVSWAADVHAAPIPVTLLGTA